MKSKNKINKQLERKTNKVLVETVLKAKKHEGWIKIASVLSGPRKGFVNLNLDEINEYSNEGDIVIVPGKVLSQGDINKKIKIAAFSFSKRAKEKLLKFKITVSDILEEVKNNPEAKGIKILENKK